LKNDEKAKKKAEEETLFKLQAHEMYKKFIYYFIK